MSKVMSGAVAGVMAALLFCAPATGKVKVGTDLGWGGCYRVGRWTPLYLTMSDDSVPLARNVVIELLVPHGNTFNVRMRQLATIDQKPRTFVVYAPLPAQLQDGVLILRDAQSGRKLAEQVIDPDQAPGPRFGRSLRTASRLSDVVIGVTGQRGGVDAAQGTYPTEIRAQGPRGFVRAAPTTAPADKLEVIATVGHLPNEMLPEMALGYDALDLLVLNAPNLAEMPAEVQEAMAQWIRSGGRMLMWAGESPMPPDSPLVKLLPCGIGDVETIDLPAASAKQSGFALQRGDKLVARRLSPRPGAQQLGLAAERMVMWTGRAGLGQVSVLSANPAQLVFENDAAGKRFWRPILWRALDPERGLAGEGAWASGWTSDDEALRTVAVQEVVNRLGDVPGVGKVDFSYVLLVVIGLMIVVGPVDWLVLKKLGRQPWTWATTAGCIALVTVGALYIGQVLRSGELHLRSVRVVEQADGQVVAGADMAGLYSPRSQQYLLEGPRGDWWEPADLDMPYERRRRLPTEVEMVQDRLGMRPMPMAVNIWNLRFMLAQVADAPEEKAAIRAKLRRVEDARGPRLAGTITNDSGAKLKNVIIRTRNGWGIVTQDASIGPGQTISVDIPINGDSADVTPPGVAKRAPGDPDMAQTMMLTGDAYTRGSAAQFSFLRAASDLKPERSKQIERLLSEDVNLACIYAEGEAPAGNVKIAEQNAVEKHWIVVRALVELER